MVKVGPLPTLSAPQMLIASILGATTSRVVVLRIGGKIAMADATAEIEYGTRFALHNRTGPQEPEVAGL